MFNRTTKQMVINANQVELFTTILINAVDAKRRTYHFLMDMTTLGASSGDTVVVCNLRGIHEDTFNVLLTKLNKYGVKVYA